MLQQNMKEKEKRLHPTQKPLPLMRWCIERFPGAQIILDPFAGSGTSLVAAKERGIKGVGIEREARYCEIIKTRLETMQLKLPIEKAREGMNRE
jgi:DNA modification methylase